MISRGSELIHRYHSVYRMDRGDWLNYDKSANRPVLTDELTNYKTDYVDELIVSTCAMSFGGPVVTQSTHICVDDSETT